MSFSRESAQAANEDPKKLDQMFAAIAREVLAQDASRRGFDRAMRKHFTALHRGGWSKEKLVELRKQSRVVFNRERQTVTSNSQNDGSATTETPWESNKVIASSRQNVRVPRRCYVQN